MKIYNFELKQIEQAAWQLEKDYQGVPVVIFAREELLKTMDEEVFIQAKNVAQLPGLYQKVYIMPDAHSGYGAPIGTVFAMKEDGFVAPGAVGFDINCGMRLITTNLTIKDVEPRLEKLVNLLFENIPAGVGRRGFLKVSKQQLKNIVENGIKEIEKMGFAWKKDLENIEENGIIKNADYSILSQAAVERGIGQLATLGSGNHYLEIQKVDQIFDQKLAEKFGIYNQNQITIMVHCGSRGLGHQVCSDYLRLFEKNLSHFKITVNDRQLACASINSSIGQQYLSAMAAAANFAFANRQLITYQVRKCFEKIFGKKAEELSMKLAYDVAHNIAKWETFKQKLLIHRKGATRSYPNQPVIIGGSMETGSYLLIGTINALEKSFGSTAHGSGRTMSRAKAKKLIQGQQLQQHLRKKGIYIKSASYAGLAEEAGFAYKNIDEVVQSVSEVGLSKPIASFKPIGNIKG